LNCDGIEADVRDFIQTNDLSYEQYLQQIHERYGIDEYIIEEYLNIYGIRDFIRNESISLPMMNSPIELIGPMLNHYIDYLKQNTPPEVWEKREDDLLTSLGKINGFMQVKKARHGLVIGDVQSGKTSNFLGLVGHAIDQRIPVIIIISGMTNILRNQTQKRFDEAFGQYEQTNFKNLTREDWSQIHRPISGGTELRWYTGDFNEPGFKPNDSTVPLVLVIKKTPNVLRNTRDWLKDWNENSAFEKSLLVIDDESDAASINTLYVNPEDLDNAEMIEEINRATTINRLIREILLTTNKSTYIGYTATPYAALLSDPHEHSELLGKSLYPRDFIIALPTPSAHSGLSEYFSRAGHLRSCISHIPTGDAHIVTDPIPTFLPDSLRSAIDDFIITGALKLIDNDDSTQFHHSMLVHAHMETSNHEKLAQFIRNYGVNLKENFTRKSLFGLLSEEYLNLKSRWESEFSVSEEQEELMANAIRIFFTKFDFDNDVCTINSFKSEEEPLFETNSRLEFKEEGTWVIAIGGQILSRGLTVEGLVISYFARQSAMYDSLAQMARWCGYHSDFVKQIIRVNTTETIHRWFQFIYTVDTRIREDVAVLEQMPNATPIELAPRILQYQREEEIFLPTRRGALQHAHLRNMSYSGTTPSTLHLCLDNDEQLDENEQLLFGLLEQVENQELVDLSKSGGVRASIRYELVEEFLRGFNQRDEHGLEIDNILSYIENCRGQGQLENWTIAIFSPGDGESTNLEWGVESLDFLPNKTQRGKMPVGRLDVLFDKRHLFADLDQELIGETRSLSRRLSRELRPTKKGLLAIYVLDGEYVPPFDSSRGFVRLHDNSERIRDIVAFGLALPESEIFGGENFYIAPGVQPINIEENE